MIDDVPRPFRAADVGAIADEWTVAPDRLGSILAEHQATMAASPGAENLVYEWRRQFDATVLVRTPSLYAVVPPSWAWEEFGDHLALSESELGALRATHERTVRGLDGVAGEDTGTAPMIVVR